jgi:hypothetical protein
MTIFFASLFSGSLAGQTVSFKDSVQEVWKRKFKKIIKIKTETDSSFERFVFGRKSHELLAATSFYRAKGIPAIINQIHFYFNDN